MKKDVSSQDKEHLILLRENVESFMGRVSRQYAASPGLLLDVAPQDHRGARPFFGPQVQIETLDIDAASGATYIADLCNCVETVGVDRFDFVVCTEVLEHTRQPFHAVDSVYMMLKPGGLAFVTTPFNFRIHGPLPDCWRFTEHGLRELFKNFETISLQTLECETRFLMPIQYTLIARKPISEK
jgi:hypothetical protein